MKEKLEDLLAAATRVVVDQGHPVATGFDIFAEVFLKNADPNQISDMRIAYMAGAEFLFHSICCMQEPGEDTTEGDLRRMDTIATEMGDWHDRLVQLATI